MAPYIPEREPHSQQDAAADLFVDSEFDPGSRPSIEGDSISEEFERERLALDRAFFAAAVETSEDAVIGNTITTGRITHWNRGAQRLYGWTASEIVGQHFSVLVPEDKRAERDVNQDYLAALTASSVVMETIQLHKDGSRINVSVRLAVVRHPQTNEPLGLCSIAREISVRTATEANNTRDQAQDKKIALALQRPMLFQPKGDAFSGLVVQTAYAMASDEALVGGDWWDTFAFNQRHVALVIGDVMGHGLNSAVFTTELRHTMRAYIREHVQPSLILYHMNQFLFQSNRLFLEGINTEGNDSPVCIALAIVERDTGKGTFAIAGMEPPIRILANGSAEQLRSIGMPLGIIADEEYEHVDFQLEAGDTLILTTDGITEARRGREFLDAKGLIRLAVEGNSGTLKQMADTILNGALSFAGGKFRDDAALVLVRRTATSPQIDDNQPGP